MYFQLSFTEQCGRDPFKDCAGICDCIFPGLPGCELPGHVGKERSATALRLRKAWRVASPPQPWKGDWASAADPLRLAAKPPGEGRSSGGSRAPRPKKARFPCVIFSFGVPLRRRRARHLPRSTETGKLLLPKIVERSRLAAECTESAYLSSAEALAQKATLLRGWLRLCAGKHAISRGDASQAPGPSREHPDVCTSCGVAPRRLLGSGRGRNAIAMERGVTRRGEFFPSLQCRCPALPLLHPVASRKWTHFSNSTFESFCML